MNNWINLVASQLLWLAAVGGASKGLPWLGPVVLMAFATFQLAPRFRARGDLVLMCLALPAGLVVDTTMALMGLLAYASPGPVHGLAPAWILALWMGFALTFNHSLHYVMRRTWLAIVLGAIAGPFSYWVASRTWGAVQFTDSLPAVLLTLGSLWGAAMGLFSYFTLRLANPRLSPSNGATA